MMITYEKADPCRRNNAAAAGVDSETPPRSAARCACRPRQA